MAISISSSQSHSLDKRAICLKLLIKIKSRKWQRVMGWSTIMIIMLSKSTHSTRINCSGNSGTWSGLPPLPTTKSSLPSWNRKNIRSSLFSSILRRTSTNGRYLLTDLRKELRLFRSCRIGSWTLQGKTRIDLKVRNNSQIRAFTDIKLCKETILPNSIHLMRCQEWKKLKSENND